MPSEEKISPDEMREMFGEMIPMEAVSIIWNGDGSKTVGQARAELRALSEKLKSWRATKEDIEGWLSKVGKKCDGSEFQEVYKAGWKDALTCVMIEVDKARRGLPS